MHVYWWHVGELRAVKLGHADDPRQRVSEYRGAYGLSGDDVRGYELGDGVDAEWVESQLRRMLEARGLRRIALRLRDAGEEEFLALGDRTFEDAHALLIDAARHIAFAEFSNRRKQQRRNGPQAPPQEQEKSQPEEEVPPPRQPPVPPPSHVASRSPAAGRRGLYLLGAVVVLGMVAGLATLRAHKDQPAATAEDGNCTIADLGNSLVHVTCDRSWVLLRWDGKWTFDRGHNERAALDFFYASDIARGGGAFPPRGPLAPLPQQAEVKPEPVNPPATRTAPPPQPAAPVTQQAEAKPEPAPQANPPASRTAPPPQPTATLTQRAEAKPEPSSSQPDDARVAAPPARQAASRPATVPPQPWQEPPPPRRQCAVSRPKPGFQVYLVTCPNSQATIGRTVESTSAWTVSESVNGTEAIEFFMRSPYAR